MLVSPFVLGVAQLNPDFVLTNVHGKRLQVIAFLIEASSAFQIEATTVPVAGENAMPDNSTSQGITHMRALVVGGVNPSIDVEKRDAPTRSDSNGLGFTLVDVAHRCYLYPVRCRFDHTIHPLVTSLKHMHPPHATTIPRVERPTPCNPITILNDRRRCGRCIDRLDHR
jgi:hypothetical protein